MPGLCDAHMHVESGMVTVTEFARAVIPHGTTSMFIDPHEIANVLGVAGVRLMHDEAMGLPINVFVQMPSCVPSAPGLENAGATITPEDVADAMTWPNIIGLGEMMNFPGVINGDAKMLAEIAATQRAGKTVGGHYASPDLGPSPSMPMQQVARRTTTKAPMSMIASPACGKACAPCCALVRPGTMWRPRSRLSPNAELTPAISFCVRTIAIPERLVYDGHMNRVVRHAIAQGLKPITAIQMATLNTAQHFGLERELGSITPGRRADLILSSDLTTLPIELVIARGQVMAENGKLTAELPNSVIQTRPKIPCMSAER